MPNYTPLPRAELNRLIQGATILEEDGFGPKVYRLPSGDILKLFRRKRLLSSALWRPHAIRFWRNAEGLQRLGIATLQPDTLYQLDDPAWTAVRYQPLPGETLSQRLRRDPGAWNALLPDLAAFIRHLHASGVYFRSLHPGNIVLTPQGEFGLIDIADMQVRRRALGALLRRRNREHFEKYLRKEGLPFDSAALWALCEQA